MIYRPTKEEQREARLTAISVAITLCFLAVLAAITILVIEYPIIAEIIFGGILTLLILVWLWVMFAPTQEE